MDGGEASGRQWKQVRAFMPSFAASAFVPLGAERRSSSALQIVNHALSERYVRDASTIARSAGPCSKSIRSC